MDARTERKLRELRGTLASFPSALVSYSGGVDSTLLAFLAHRELAGRMRAVIVSSPLLPPRELRRAVDIAAALGFPCTVLEEDVLSVPGFASNPRERCYLCKKHLLGRLKTLAADGGFAAVLDGSHADDSSSHRPGERALEEEGVASPLKAAGLGKAEIRALAAWYGLPNRDAPSRPCLATRFPHDTELSPELLRRVDAAEEWLEGLGLRELRVRVDGPGQARIEAGREEMRLLDGKERRERLVKKFRELGFRRVELDLEGYRRGSMDGKRNGGRVLTLFQG
ncbi:MAG: ATP-dependent sacrificial sulfur transferase LarE [Actinobacteria bacterium]|nr:ATP-dependent sacrificial sulfur transferase LarE [Actinomycetota bacterium]